MNHKYDLVVIGAGTAAMGVASWVRAAGWTVAVADFRPFGGTCALRGCDPKKLLISGTSAIDQVTRMHGNGGGRPRPHRVVGADGFQPHFYRPRGGAARGKLQRPRH